MRTILEEQATQQRAALLTIMILPTIAIPIFLFPCLLVVDSDFLFYYCIQKAIEFREFVTSVALRTYSSYFTSYSGKGSTCSWSSHPFFELESLSLAESIPEFLFGSVLMPTLFT